MQSIDLNIILTIIFTGIGTVATIIGANLALLSWLRADMKSFEAKIDGWKEQITTQTTDFHGRLCTLEERKKSKGKH